MPWRLLEDLQCPDKHNYSLQRRCAPPSKCGCLHRGLQYLLSCGARFNLLQVGLAPGSPAWLSFKLPSACSPLCHADSSFPFCLQQRWLLRTESAAGGADFKLFLEFRGRFWRPGGPVFGLMIHPWKVSSPTAWGAECLVGQKAEEKAVLGFSSLLTLIWGELEVPCEWVELQRIRPYKC